MLIEQIIEFESFMYSLLLILVIFMTKQKSPKQIFEWLHLLLQFLW